MSNRQNIQTALDVKLGRAPKSNLDDPEIAGYYYNYTVKKLESMLKNRNTGAKTKWKK